MRLQDFDFDLPEGMIAQEPLPRRDQSRLLHLRASGALAHRHVYDLPALLSAGDLLVVNDTRVFPARLLGRTKGGSRVEVLLLRQQGPHDWQALARPARKLRPGTELVFGDGRLQARVTGAGEGGLRELSLSHREDLQSLLATIGRTPLPPYIKRQGLPSDGVDRERYQTVYARQTGSIAAPTAGLHLTPQLLDALRERGIRVTELTLHVGYGTFRPIREDHIEDHRMDEELFHIPASCARAIEETRQRGGRVVAVGTTCVRALESAAADRGLVTPGPGRTALFIYPRRPGFRFRVVDSLLTNFHLPRSSLLLLVAALASWKLTKRAYDEAINEGYRFYSYGDCMLYYP